MVSVQCQFHQLDIENHFSSINASLVKIFVDMEEVVALIDLKSK